MAKSLNRVMLIGNLTRDPELRNTTNGAPVCSFGLATNRQWTTESGEKKDSPEFHNIVAWTKLAEICSKFLEKGSQVYVEGRIETRKWKSEDGTEKSRVEIIIDNMIILGKSGKQVGSESEKPAEEGKVEDIHPDEIPF